MVKFFFLDRYFRAHRFVLIQRPFPRHLASGSKRVFVQNISYENEFDLNENEHVGGTHFHTKVFARRLVLTQRQKAIRKWPIESSLQCKASDSCACKLVTKYINPHFSGGEDCDRKMP